MSSIHRAFEILHQPRDYQTRTVERVNQYWGAGGKRVLVVAPTGSGKTIIAALLTGASRTLWVAHRRELIEQAALKLENLAGVGNVNRVMPGVPMRKRFPDARIQVGTIQTLLGRDPIAGVDLLVLDEAHRYAALEYRRIAEAYRESRTLGITATPERHDGKPLGDIFDHLIVAAQHSELIAAGHIMRLRVVRAAADLWQISKKDESVRGAWLAQEPVQAYAEHSDGARAFVFASSVAKAEEYAKSFRRQGIRAGCVEGKTPRRFRALALGHFGEGKTRVLTSVYTLNEGLDIPDAACAILARPFDFIGGMLQSVGRIARPAQGKAVATVIDLVGATLRHGNPNADRVYSLEGRAIASTGESREYVPLERAEPRVLETAMEVADEGSAPPGWVPTPVMLRIKTRAERDHEEEQRVFRKHGARHAEFFARYQARMRGEAAP